MNLNETDVLQTTTPAPRRVLVTGAAGAIGRRVAPAIAARGHEVRGFDLTRHADLRDFVVGDLRDRAAVDQAMEGVQSVVHLAAVPDEADLLTTLMPTNVVGLYHMYEAARQAGVERFILASSVRAASFGRDHPRPIRVEDGPAPHDFYSLTKVWAEQMGQLYARKFDLPGLVVRIAWFPRNQHEVERIVKRDRCDFYLSHDDAARCFIRCIEADDPPGGFGILFAVSDQGERPNWDPAPAERLVGYRPRDRWPQGLDVEDWTPAPSTDS